MKILSAGPKGSFFVTVLMPDSSVSYSKEYQLGDLNVYRYPDEGTVIFVETGDEAERINKELFSSLINGDSGQPFASYDELDAWISDNMFLSAGSGGTGGGGSGGTIDVTNLATKQNQVTQLTRETEIRDNIIALLAKVPANPATSDGQASELTALASILSKLSGDPASQTTLAAILAKLISNPATADNQASEITALTALGAKDFATQATLNAVLLKLSADPSTGGKQDTGNTALASILAKIIAAPSTEAKQDAAIAILTSLAAITTEVNTNLKVATAAQVSTLSPVNNAGRFVRINNESVDDIWISTTNNAPAPFADGCFKLLGSPIGIGGVYESPKKITNAIYVYNVGANANVLLTTF